ncbi:MAG: type I DNA topoisomerase [Candidatus Omnitrophica bacterium]|nr:type I DNA topoisomerase [Candidatus Omnitrophota bacterium]
MGEKLVIVESPTKSKTINRILGKDFIVKASMGHVRDLPVAKLGVDVKNNFNPIYVDVKSRAKVVKELKRLSSSAEAIYLATDPDREGEAIAWHLMQVLNGGKEKKYYRVQYNEITEKAIRYAFDHPGDIDIKRVESQQARRILDRLVGYKVSPILWKGIKRGLSAGRVQSVALRLICEREKEINGFTPEFYWVIGAIVKKLKEPITPFYIKLVHIDGKKADIKDEGYAREVMDSLQKSILTVQSVESKTVLRRPFPPFITSSLQQAAATNFAFPPSKTMQIAQRLYEGIDLGDGPVGLITYMRTDSFSIADEAMFSCREYIRKTLGDGYVPGKPNVYKSRQLSQGAHEAIRPTDIMKTPDLLKDKMDKSEWKLYDLIWRRFVASQMSPAVIDQKVAKILAMAPAGQQNSHEYIFHATASEIKFPGYMRVYSIERSKGKQENGSAEEMSFLPPLEKGEELECIEWKNDKKQTQPPSRYTDASLIKALESYGVGRPSTFAQILSTLYVRKYVLKEKNSILPTELGMKVNDLLVNNLSELFDVKFTAKMEEDLDKIESGEISWQEMLKNFYEKLISSLEKIRFEEADANAVREVLDAISKVENWELVPSDSYSKFNEKKFVESIKRQIKNGKNLSKKQLTVLGNIAAKYASQIDGIQTLLEKWQLNSEKGNNEDQENQNIFAKKIEALKKVDLNLQSKKFVASISKQIEDGKRLSDPQKRVIDKILITYSSKIENFEELKKEFNISEKDLNQRQDDALINKILGAFKHFKGWKGASKKGNKTFDDKKFFESISNYYNKNQNLSPRQYVALCKLAARYKSQISELAALLPQKAEPKRNENE